MGEPSEKDGSFSIPAEQPTRHFTDAEVRRNYEYILTSTNLYPPELHSAVRSVLSEPPLNPDWSDKGRQIAALFTPYGDREYQGDLLYRTRLHGEDGISFFFDEGYTYIPWNGLAFLLDAMIEDGDYPNPVVEEQPDPILWSFTINTVPITAWSITIYKGKVGKRCYYLLRDDFLKYNRYRRQCDLLWERQITTLDELLTYKENLQAEYNALTAQRKALYRRKSKTTPADYSEQIQALTARIRELRREITTCADIEMDCEMVQDKVQRAAHRRENPPRERIHRRAY